MSRDCCVALPHDATGLSAVCDCGISCSYALTIFVIRGTCDLLIYCSIAWCLFRFVPNIDFYNVPEVVPLPGYVFTCVKA